MVTMKESIMDTVTVNHDGLHDGSPIIEKRRKEIYP